MTYVYQSAFVGTRADRTGQYFHPKRKLVVHNKKRPEVSCFRPRLSYEQTKRATQCRMAPSISFRTSSQLCSYANPPVYSSGPSRRHDTTRDIASTAMTCSFRYASSALNRAQNIVCLEYIRAFILLSIIFQVYLPQLLGLSSPQLIASLRSQNLRKYLS